MKYGIREQLPEAAAELAQAFHAALMLRLYQVQVGATPSIDNPLDCAIAAMHRWRSAKGGAVAAIGLDALQRAAFEHVAAIVDQADAQNYGAPLWYGWAVREAFVGGAQWAARTALDGGGA